MLKTDYRAANGRAQATALASFACLSGTQNRPVASHGNARTRADDDR